MDITITEERLRELLEEAAKKGVERVLFPNMRHKVGGVRFQVQVPRTEWVVAVLKAIGLDCEDKTANFSAAFREALIRGLEPFKQPTAVEVTARVENIRRITIRVDEDLITEIRQSKFTVLQLVILGLVRMYSKPASGADE